MAPFLKHSLGEVARDRSSEGQLKGIRAVSVSLCNCNSVMVVSVWVCCCCRVCGQMAGASCQWD